MSANLKTEIFKNERIQFRELSLKVSRCINKREETIVLIAFLLFFPSTTKKKKIVNILKEILKEENSVVFINVLNWLFTE